MSGRSVSYIDLPLRGQNWNGCRVQRPPGESPREEIKVRLEISNTKANSFSLSLSLGSLHWLRGTLKRRNGTIIADFTNNGFLRH